MGIKGLRQKLGWSQSDLAEYAGVSVKTIHRIENGKVIPSIETVKSLAAVFKVPFGDLMVLAAPENQNSSARTGKESKSDSFVETTNTHSRPILLYRLNWQAVSVIGLVSALLLLVFNYYWRVTTDLSSLADERATNGYDVIVEDRANKPLNQRIASFTDDFAAYYGQSLSPRRFAPITWTTTSGTRLTELEVATFISIAYIVTSSPDQVAENRNDERALVLEPVYQCYSAVRTPVTVGMYAANLTRLFDCFYQSVDDVGWLLSLRQKDELDRLNRYSMNIERPDQRYVAVEY